MFEVGKRAEAVDASQWVAASLMTVGYEKDDLRAYLDSSAQLARELDRVPGWWAAHALALALDDRPDDARAAIAPLLEQGLASLPPDATFVAMLWSMASVASELGDREIAEQVDPLVQP